MATPLRNMRISDEDWKALGVYAEREDTNRSAVVVELIRQACADCYEPEQPPEGQMVLL